jgi:hypothetical protein
MAEPEQSSFHSILDVLDRLLSKPIPESWGNWKLDRERRAIYYDGGHDYWFSLGQMNNSAEVLDWIVQLHEQKWATPEDVGHLVAALNDIFDLQNTMCGCGIEHRFDAKAHLEKVLPSDEESPETPTELPPIN